LERKKCGKNSSTFYKMWRRVGLGLLGLMRVWRLNETTIHEKWFGGRVGKVSRGDLLRK
jgi:hypothetical protein